MAVSIDKVYQKVLALANKEQRGYITPQEFNLFADHAQMDIFDQYFYDLDRPAKSLPSQTDYTDKAKNLNEKISLFEVYQEQVSATGSTGDVILANMNIYRLGAVSVSYSNNHAAFLNGSSGKAIATQLSLSEVEKYDTPLTSWKSLGGPFFMMYHMGSSAMRIKVLPFPVPGDSVYVSYIKKPASPNWTYNIVGTDALYNPDPTKGFKDFELHHSEENNLVIKILQLAGISIKDPQLAGIAAQEDMINKQEKQ